MSLFQRTQQILNARKLALKLVFLPILVLLLTTIPIKFFSLKVLYSRSSYC